MPVGRLSGAPVALQLADVIPWLHPWLAVLQAAQLAPILEICPFEALVDVAILVVYVHHPRLCVEFAEAPPPLTSWREGWVLVAERALTSRGGGGRARFGAGAGWSCLPALAAHAYRDTAKAPPLTNRERFATCETSIVRPRARGAHTLARLSTLFSGSNG